MGRATGNCCNFTFSGDFLLLLSETGLTASTLSLKQDPNIQTV